MTRGSTKTPAGALWALAGVVILALSGCDRATDSGPAVLELEGDTIRLEAGVRLLDVNVATQQDGSELDPARVEARPGDVVRFTAGDGRLHALAFEPVLLTAEARAFLEQRGQLRSPPLVAAGTQWVITLDGAPPGEYAYSCTTHGVRGSIVVGQGSN